MQAACGRVVWQVPRYHTRSTKFNSIHSNQTTRKSVNKNRMHCGVGGCQEQGLEGKGQPGPAWTTNISREDVTYIWQYKDRTQFLSGNALQYN